MTKSITTTLKLRNHLNRLVLDSFGILITNQSRAQLLEHSYGQHLFQEKKLMFLERGCKYVAYM